MQAGTRDAHGRALPFADAGPLGTGLVAKLPDGTEPRGPSPRSPWGWSVTSPDLAKLSDRADRCEPPEGGP
jgi:hypothetical protein